jgi:hypothetical protein
VGCLQARFLLVQLEGNSPPFMKVKAHQIQHRNRIIVEEGFNDDVESDRTRDGPANKCGVQWVRMLSLSPRQLPEYIQNDQLNHSDTLKKPFAV